jgi:MFS transporter, OFA family, oxalate/formate antiporter
MVLATVALSNMQYGWTLFVNPMREETHWATAGIQFAFSILIFLNTWLAPAEGWVADRWGPRFVVMVGGVAAGASWVLNSRAHSLESCMWRRPSAAWAWDACSARAWGRR